MYFYCYFSFEYFDPYDHYVACWVTLTVITSRGATYQTEDEVDVFPAVGVPHHQVGALTSLQCVEQYPQGPFQQLRLIV